MRKIAFPLIALAGLLQAGCDRREAAIPFTEASAARNADGTYRVRWAAPGASTVTLYAGTDVAPVGRARPVGAGTASGEVAVSGLAADRRWYFELVPDSGHPLTIADRGLHLEGAPNFRDAGGYRTADGKWVRMGLLYRSDGLDALTDGDLATIRRAGIRLICDLRADDERERAPNRLPEGAEVLIADVVKNDEDAAAMMAALMGGSDAVPGALATAADQEARFAAFMDRSYRRMAVSDTAHAAYRAVFGRLTGAAPAPTVFHCSGGRDRTGWTNAVFLTALGVPRETVLQDYLLSNVYLAPRSAKLMERLQGRFEPAVLEKMAKLQPEYLATGFAEVERRYGSFDAYLRDGIGLHDAQLARLREHFLAD